LNSRPDICSQSYLPSQIGTSCRTGRVSLPSLAPGAGYLAFTRQAVDVNVYRLALGGAMVKPERIQQVSSTRPERFSRYSPDGRRIAFQSERSGFPEIWMCNADGSNAFALTQFEGSGTGSPAWSPTVARSRSTPASTDSLSST
ncbi:MAG TPA: hypothetical protein VES20_07070, partial [Bryobacteraceae bacterium]|nr:hypothetical protein [Bryobacteraceae bacterium]